ncbi:MAG: hypothetical protein AAF740_03830 [Bacteroidota bacterium]
MVLYKLNGKQKYEDFGVLFSALTRNKIRFTDWLIALFLKGSE